MVTDDLPTDRRNRWIDANLTEYGEEGHALAWISDSQAIQAERLRGDYIKALQDTISFLFKETKPVYGQLSPGCQICGSGAWSCLFINGKCNCRCFYCPTVQDDISVPTTNRVPFNRSTDYVDYVAHFGFKGVSISGGEPLLTIDRTLDYIQAVRKKQGDGFHIWLYTNGTLLTRDYALRLKAAGLNEIRFDISAAHYDLSKIALAAGVIPIITVEIPAIPEDMDRLSDLTPQMADAGVNFLNLHQLRLTPFNHKNLKNRPYTFLHGPKVTVLESELMVFSLLQKAAHFKWPLSINYCSFVYKNRFQGAGTRARNARFIVKGHESITENGYIRSLALSGPPERIQKNAEQLNNRGVDRQRFFVTGKKDRIFFHESLWRDMDFEGASLSVGYGEAFLSPAISYRHVFKEILVNAGKKIIVEKRSPVAEVHLTEQDRTLFEIRIIHRKEMREEETSRTFDETIAPFEWIEPGLQAYY